VLLSGIVPGHDQVLDALGVADQLRREGLVFPDTPAAIAYARTLALTSAGDREGRRGHKPPLPRDATQVTVGPRATEPSAADER
jgi:hypothetical protein